MTRDEYTTTYSLHKIPDVLYNIGGFNLSKSSYESETEFVSNRLCEVLGAFLDETGSNAYVLGHFITLPCLNMKERTVSWRFQEQPELLDMLCKNFGWGILEQLLQKHSGSLGLQSLDKMISLVPTTGIINCFASFFYECTDCDVRTCLLSVVQQRLAVPDFFLFDDHLEKWKAILINCSKYDKYDIKSYNDGHLQNQNEQKYFCDVVQFFLDRADSRICVTLLNDASFLLGTRNDFAPVIVEMFHLFADVVKKEICFDMFESVDEFNRLNVDDPTFLFNDDCVRDKNAPLWSWKGAEQLFVYAMKQNLPVLNKFQYRGTHLYILPDKKIELIVCARLVKLLPPLPTLTTPFKDYVRELVPQAVELTNMRFKFLLGPQVWQLVRSARDAVRAMVRSKLFPQIQMMPMGEFEELHGYPLSRKQQEQFHKGIFFLSGDLMDHKSNMLISDWDINTILEQLLTMACTIDLTTSKRRGNFREALGHLLVLTEYLLERRAQGQMLRVKVTLLAKAIAKCRIMVTRPPNTNNNALTEALLPYGRQFFNQASASVRENLAQKALICYSQDSWSTIKCGFYIDLVLTEYLLECRAQGEMLPVNVTLLTKVIAKCDLSEALLPSQSVRENLAQKALNCYSQDSWSTIKCGFYIDLAKFFARSPLLCHATNGKEGKPLLLLDWHESKRGSSEVWFVIWWCYWLRDNGFSHKKQKDNNDDKSPHKKQKVEEQSTKGTKK